MLNAFASVGVQAFDLTFLDLDGKQLERGGFLRNRSVGQLRHAIGPLLREKAAQHHNVIIRPHKTERAQLIQLDDLTRDGAHRVAPHAFLLFRTSPGESGLGNFQAWLAVAPKQGAEFARRVRKKLGADISASGATRIAGSRNIKRRYEPDFPIVTIVNATPGRIVTKDELAEHDLVGEPEPETAPRLVSFRASPGREPKTWPSYERCLDGAPLAANRNGQKDRSLADWTFSLLAVDWGFSIEATADKLMEVSAKAHEKGRDYAMLTASNAAAAVAKRLGKAR